MVFVVLVVLDLGVGDKKGRVLVAIVGLGLSNQWVDKRGAEIDR
jgi:hypothetical protein